MNRVAGRVPGLSHSGRVVLALVMAVVVVISPVMMHHVSAGVIQTKSIIMERSSIGATNVRYDVGFTTPASATVGGLVIDFCTNSPLPATACTAPGGLAANNASTLIYSQTGLSGFVVDTVDAQANRIILTDASPGTVNGAVSFSLGDGTTNGFTNPSAHGTFYGRIYTYATAAAAQGHDSDAASGYIDTGSVALTTAQQITVTSIVRVLLNLCVYTGANCAAGGTAVDLGDDFGLLRPSGTFVDVNTKYDLETNAEDGAVLYFKATLPTAGSHTLASIGSSATAPTAGVSEYGLCTHETTANGMVIAAPYDGTNCSAATQTAGTNTPGGVNGALFAFDTAAAAGADGDLLASVNAGVYAKGRIAFAANVAPSQPSGTYETELMFIATGHY